MLYATQPTIPSHPLKVVFIELHKILRTTETIAGKTETLLVCVFPPFHKTNLEKIHRLHVRNCRNEFLFLALIYKLLSFGVQVETFLIRLMAFILSIM